jgi:hypothetical protein
MKRLRNIAILGAVLTSCASHPTVCVNTSQPLTEEESRIVEVARREVVTGDKFFNRYEVDLLRRDPDGGWFVSVWRLPKTPGGFVTVVINENGTIREVIPGH